MIPFACVKKLSIAKVDCIEARFWQLSGKIKMEQIGVLSLHMGEK